MRRLPDAELDVMDVLWSATGPLTTRAVVESVPAERGWKIQTVATLLGRLQAKGFVRSTRTGRDLHYVAEVDRDEYLAFETGRFMERFHRGSLRSLLASFAADRPVDDAERRELEAWLDARERGTDRP